MDRDQAIAALVSAKDRLLALEGEAARYRAFADAYHDEIEYLREQVRAGAAKQDEPTEESSLALALAAERLRDAQEAPEDEEEKVPASDLNARINEVFMGDWNPPGDSELRRAGSIFMMDEKGEETETEDGSERDG
jgi:hypothetical protein